MNLSNFDFDALDHATRDETLARLTCPIVPGFELDPSRPIESLDNAWHETDWQSDWQQTSWQQHSAHAHAYNEPQGAIQDYFQGQTHSPTMLVEFHPNFNIQENDKTHYNLVPWTGLAETQGLTIPTQNLTPLESFDTHDLNRIEARDRNRTKAEDLKRIEEARAARCCTWKDCRSNSPFSSDAALEGHLEGHARDVIQRWSRDTECTWSGCVSKAKFKLLSPLRLHLENAHVKPLLCIRPGCSFKRPFRNISDLQRHIQTEHSRNGGFRCPYKECRSSTRIFARKDKWLEHVQDAEHQLDNFCPVQHCEKEARYRCGFLSPKEAIKHMFNEHGGTSLDVRDFSCAIGGCEAGDPPSLTKSQLKKHLIADHSFVEVTQQVVLDAVEATEVHQVRRQLIPAGIKFDSCRLCLPLPPPKHGFETLTSFLHRRKTFESVVYCCQCDTPRNPRIDYRCTGCPEHLHEFCSGCRTERLPGSGLQESEPETSGESSLGGNGTAPRHFMKGKRKLTDLDHMSARKRSREQGINRYEVVYCCQCNSVNNLTLDRTCSGCVGAQHEFCSDCKFDLALPRL